MQTIYRSGQYSSLEFLSMSQSVNSSMNSPPDLQEGIATNAPKTNGTETKSLLSKLDELKNEMKNTLLMEEIPLVRASTLIQLTKKLSRGSVLAYDQLQQPQEKSKIDEIRSNILGFNTRYISPFNIELQTVYVDHTATNRPYKTVETMVEHAKKFSANPHTEFSHFGKYSTEMMHYAQESLLRSLSVSTTDYVALPTGSGSTGAIEKTIKILKTMQDENTQQKPDVFLTPYEHHSNILPWVEFYDSVSVLASDEHGNLLMKEIQEQLINCKNKKIIVTASAASNVTSKITDLKSFNAVIKRVKKVKDLIFSVDCAAYCCHHELNLNIFDEIDFAHLSPHKNLGGAESCGILIAKKSIVTNAKPTFPGGGTVAFVKGYQKEDVMYDVDIFNREIAGTPPFFGFYRAALSFELLKNDIGYDFIHKREKENTELFMSMIEQANRRFKEENLQKRIVVYGDTDFNVRANVITFNILSEAAIIQHSFASLIFADVFGIQLRSGCFCAGPFGMKLLNLDEETTRIIQEKVSVGIMRDKPGYMRLDLTFYLELYEIEYLANAIISVTQFAKNMELVYTICNDGEIKRHKLFKNILNDMYSLDKNKKAEKILQLDRELDEGHLKKRKHTLQKQLNRGMEIVKSPVNFLKTQHKLK